MKKLALALLFALFPTLAFGQTVDADLMADDLPKPGEYNERAEITVGYLIKQLEKCDPNMPVTCLTDATAIPIGDSGHRPIADVSIRRGKVVITPKSPGAWGAGYPKFINDLMPASVREQFDETAKRLLQTKAG